MKKSILLILLILLVSSLFAQEQHDYLEKYSNSMSWTGNSGNGEVCTGGNVITEVKIKEVSDKNKITVVQIKHTMTPFVQEVETEVKTEYSDGAYSFSFNDKWGNKIDGHFAVFKDNASLILTCSDFSIEGKNFARLYNEKINLRKTTEEPEFFQNALEADKIKAQLVEMHSYWRMDSENTYLSVNYIGKIKNFKFYCTSLNWNKKSGNRCTNRLVLFNDNEYLGNYPGIQADNFYIKSNVLIVANGRLRNEIDFSKIIPAYILINGEYTTFQK